jgi:hypothetical protein
MNTPTLYPNIYNASAGISLHGSILLTLFAVTLLLLGIGLIIQDYEWRSAQSTGRI